MMWMMYVMHIRGMDDLCDVNDLYIYDVDDVCE